jgi:hypothetical protein
MKNRILNLLKGKAWKISIAYVVKYIAVLVLTSTLLKINHDASKRVLGSVRMYETLSTCTVTDTYIVDRVCVAEVTVSTSNNVHFTTSYYGRRWDTRTAEAAEEFCLDHPTGSVSPCMIANSTMRTLFISQYESALHYARHEILKYKTNLSVVITIDVILTLIPILVVAVKLYREKDGVPYSKTLDQDIFDSLSCENSYDPPPLTISESIYDDPMYDPLTDSITV